VEQDGGPTARNRLRSWLSAYFNYLISEGLLNANPVQGTGKADEGGSRDRVLSEAELRGIWLALDDSDVSDIIRLLILTGRRSDEIASMNWSELNFDSATLTLPPERTKNRLRHEVPLSQLVLSILRNWWSHAKDALDAKLNGIAPWHIHDIRRSIAPGMGELSILPHIIEAVLNHISGHKGGIAGVLRVAEKVIFEGISSRDM